MSFIEVAAKLMAHIRGQGYKHAPGDISALFATPAVVLGTAAGAGAAASSIRSDSTIVAFDATAPVAQAYGDAAAVGSVAVAARRNHVHGMPNEVMPNLIPNSDFGRARIIATVMPETFVDLTAWTAVSGTIGTVSGSVLTPGSTGVWRIKWNGPTDMWRDGRWNAQFKATTVGETRAVTKWIDANNYVEAQYTGTNIAVVKNIGGVLTTVASSALTLTLNHFYWLELRVQGTKHIASIFDVGVAATDKPTAPTSATANGTVSDAAVAAGGISIMENNTTVSTWGHRSATPGGVYVEARFPDSWTANASGYGGTLGGQALSFDEAADAGPLGQQLGLRIYIPATSRNWSLQQIIGTNVLAPSTAYTGSAYLKVASKGGSGALAKVRYYETATDSVSNPVTNVVADGSETTWTRKSVAFTSASTTRRATIAVDANLDGTATGIAYFQLLHLELGSTLTPWRNAPTDYTPIVWRWLRGAADISTTSTSYIEADNRELAENIYLPWDAYLQLTFSGNGYHNTTGSYFQLAFSIDGTTQNGLLNIASFNNLTSSLQNLGFSVQNDATLATAGKHRVALLLATNSGTVTINSLFYWQTVTIVAYRGR